MIGEGKKNDIVAKASHYIWFRYSGMQKSGHRFLEMFMYYMDLLFMHSCVYLSHTHIKNSSQMPVRKKNARLMSH